MHISDYDDQIVASLVTQIRKIMKRTPTISNITACFNIMCGLLDFCAIQGDEESLTVLADNFHKGMIDHIKEICRD